MCNRRFLTNLDIYTRKLDKCKSEYWYCCKRWICSLWTISPVSIMFSNVVCCWCVRKRLYVGKGCDGESGEPVCIHTYTHSLDKNIRIVSPLIPSPYKWNWLATGNWKKLRKREARKFFARYLNYGRFISIGECRWQFYSDNVTHFRVIMESEWESANLKNVLSINFIG